MPDIYTDPEILNSEVLPPVEPTRPMPPPFVAAPRTAFGYSTVGPSDFSSVQTGTMGGVPVMLPANAQNAFAVQGPVPTPESEFDRYWKQNYANLPVDQAEQAITAATQYQGIRQYQRLLDQGASASEAFQKAAPMMFYSGRGSGAALSGLSRMMQPKADYQFVPGTDVAPATFQSPGQRPVIVSRSALPMAEKNIVPKVFTFGGRDYLYNPSTGAITTPKGTELSDKDRMNLARAIPKMISDMQDISRESPEYATARAMLEMVKREAAGAPAAPKSTAGIPVTDTRGVKWRYLGSAKNPKSDTNPANWVKE